MKILCILQNAWGWDGSEHAEAMRLFFRVNPRNKSGKRMYGICEGHDMYFTNASTTITATASGKGKTDIENLKEAVKAQEYDLYIVCGSQAAEAVNKISEEHINGVIIFMPHPASRNLTNKLCYEVKSLIQSEDYRWFSKIYFIQGKGHFKVKFDDKVFDSLSEAIQSCVCEYVRLFKTIPKFIKS